MLEYSVRIRTPFESRPFRGCLSYCRTTSSNSCTPDPNSYCLNYQSYNSLSCRPNFCSQLHSTEQGQCDRDCGNSEITGRAGSLAFIGQGSGFFVGDDEVLTNWHVVKDSDRIPKYPFEGPSMLTFYERDSDGSGRPFLGQIKWFDRDNDVALIERLPSSPSFNGESVTFGSFNNLKLLDILISIGSPKGVDFTATLGYLTNKVGNGDKPECTYCFSYSVPSGRGASGSPIYNREYELIGIHHSVKLEKTRGYSPVDALKQGTNVNRIQDLLDASYPTGTNLDVTNCSSNQLQNNNLVSCMRRTSSSESNPSSESLQSLEVLFERESRKSGRRRGRFSLENSRLEIRGDELRR